MGRSGTRVVDESRTTYTVTGLGQDEFNAVVEFAYMAVVDISTWGHGSSKFGYSYTVDHPKTKPQCRYGCVGTEQCMYCSARDFAKNVGASIRGMYSDSELISAKERMQQYENEAIASSLRSYADSLDRRGVETPDPSCCERGSF